MRRLVWLIAVASLFLVPVECTLVHGPHSIFVPPAAIAALADDQEPGHTHEQDEHNSHDERDQGHHPDGDSHAAPELTVGPDVAVVASDAGGSLLRFALFAPVAEDDASEATSPRAVPATAHAAAPGVPAVLIGTGDRLLIPALTQCWANEFHPAGRLLPGPEPPPP